jgi:hypothetical protein
MGKDTLKVSYLCSFIKGWDALGGLIPPFQGEHSLSLLKAAPLQALQEEIRFPHSFFSTLEAHLAKSKRCSLELGGVHATVNLFPGFLNKCFKLGSVTGSRILLRLTWQNLLHIHIQEKLLMILTIFCSVCYQVCGEVQEDTQLKEVIPCHSNFSFMPDGELLLASEGDWSELARRCPFNLTSSRERACSRSALLTNGCTVQYRWVLEVAVNEEWQDCKATLLVERHDLPWRYLSSTSIIVLSQKVKRGRTRITLQEGGTLIKLPTKENWLTRLSTTALQTTDARPRPSPSTIPWSSMISRNEIRSATENCDELWQAGLALH